MSLNHIYKESPLKKIDVEFNNLDVNEESKLNTLTVDKTTTFGKYTDAEMNAIVNPEEGMIIYNTTQNQFYGYVNGNWSDISSGGLTNIPSDLENIDSVEMNNSVPANTTNKLYNNNGVIYYDGNPINTFEWESNANAIYPRNLLKTVSIGTTTPNPALALDVHGGDARFNGDIFVSGSVSSVSQLQVQDNIISSNVGNPGDVIDGGFITLYNESSQDKASGIYRDSNDGKWNLFKNSEQSNITTSQTIDKNATGYELGTLVSNIEAEEITTSDGVILSNSHTAGQHTDDRIYKVGSDLYWNDKNISGGSGIFEDKKKTYNVNEGFSSAYQQIMSADNVSWDNILDVKMSNSGFMVVSYHSSSSMRDKIRIFYLDGSDSWVETGQSPLTLQNWETTPPCGCRLAVDGDVLVCGEVHAQSNRKSRFNIYEWNSNTNELEYRLTGESEREQLYGCNVMGLKDGLFICSYRTPQDDDWFSIEYYTLDTVNWTFSRLSRTSNLITQNEYLESIEVINNPSLQVISCYRYFTPDNDDIFLHASFFTDSNTFTSTQNVAELQDLSTNQNFFIIADTEDVNYQFFYLIVPEITPGNTRIYAYEWDDGNTEWIQDTYIDINGVVGGGNIERNENYDTRYMTFGCAGGNKLSLIIDEHSSNNRSYIRVYDLDKTVSPMTFTETNTFYPTDNTNYIRTIIQPDNSEWLVSMEENQLNQADGHFNIREFQQSSTDEIDYKYLNGNFMTNQVYIKDDGYLRLPMISSGMLNQIDLEEGCMFFDKTNDNLKIWYNDQWNVYQGSSGGSSVPGFSQTQKTYDIYNDYSSAYQQLMSADNVSWSNIADVKISESDFMVVSYHPSDTSMKDKLRIFYLDNNNTWVETAQSPLTLQSWDTSPAHGARLAVDNDIVIAGEFRTLSSVSHSYFNVYEWNPATKELEFRHRQESYDDYVYGSQAMDLKGNLFGCSYRHSSYNEWIYIDFYTLDTVNWELNRFLTRYKHTLDDAFIETLEIVENPSLQAIVSYRTRHGDEDDVGVWITYFTDNSTYDSQQDIVLQDISTSNNFFVLSDVQDDIANPFIYLVVPEVSAGDTRVYPYKWDSGNSEWVADGVGINITGVVGGGGIQRNQSYNGRYMKFGCCGGGYVNLIIDQFSTNSLSYIKSYITDKTTSPITFTLSQSIYATGNTDYIRTVITQPSSGYWLVSMEENTGNQADGHFNLRYLQTASTETVNYEYLNANLETNQIYVRDNGYIRIPLITMGELSQKNDLEDGALCFDSTNNNLKLWYNNQWSVWNPVSGFGVGNQSGYIPGSGDLWIEGEVEAVKAIQLDSNTPTDTTNKIYTDGTDLFFNGKRYTNKYCIQVNSNPIAVVEAGTIKKISSFSLGTSNITLEHNGSVVYTYTNPSIDTVYTESVDISLSEGDNLKANNGNLTLWIEIS